MRRCCYCQCEGVHLFRIKVPAVNSQCKQKCKDHHQVCAQCVLFLGVPLHPSQQKRIPPKLKSLWTPKAPSSDSSDLILTFDSLPNPVRIPVVFNVTHLSNSISRGEVKIIGKFDQRGFHVQSSECTFLPDTPNPPSSRNAFADKTNCPLSATDNVFSIPSPAFLSAVIEQSATSTSHTNEFGPVSSAWSISSEFGTPTNSEFISTHLSNESTIINVSHLALEQDEENNSFSAISNGHDSQAVMHSDSVIPASRFESLSSRAFGEIERDRDTSLFSGLQNIASFNGSEVSSNQIDDSWMARSSSTEHNSVFPQNQSSPSILPVNLLDETESRITPLAELSSHEILEKTTIDGKLVRLSDFSFPQQPIRGAQSSFESLSISVPSVVVQSVLPNTLIDTSIQRRDIAATIQMSQLRFNSTSLSHSSAGDEASCRPSCSDVSSQTDDTYFSQSSPTRDQISHPTETGKSVLSHSSNSIVPFPPLFLLNNSDGSNCESAILTELRDPISNVENTPFHSNVSLPQTAPFPGNVISLDESESAPVALYPVLGQERVSCVPGPSPTHTSPMIPKGINLDSPFPQISESAFESRRAIFCSAPTDPESIEIFQSISSPSITILAPFPSQQMDITSKIREVNSTNEIRESFSIDSHPFEPFIPFDHQDRSGYIGTSNCELERAPHIVSEHLKLYSNHEESDEDRPQPALIDGSFLERFRLRGTVPDSCLLAQASHCVQKSTTCSSTPSRFNPVLQSDSNLNISDSEDSSDSSSSFSSTSSSCCSSSSRSSSSSSSASSTTSTSCTSSEEPSTIRPTTRASPLLSSIPFNSDQLLALTHKKHYCQWGPESCRTALRFLLMAGRTAYDFLRTKLNYPFPSVSTLNRRLSELKCGPGVQTQTIDMVSARLRNEPKMKRDCVLVMDEMNTDPSLQIVQQEVVGLATLPSKFQTSQDNLSSHPTFSAQQDIATNLFAIQARGITEHWKELIGYHFTSAKTDKKELSKFLIQCIQQLEKAGLRVRAVVSDMGSTNLSILKQFGVFVRHDLCGTSESARSPFHVPNIALKNFFENPIDSSRKIYWIPDPTHILKNVRNQFEKNNFLFPGKTLKQVGDHLSSNIASFSDLEQMHALQGDQFLKLAPRLQDWHLHPKNQEKMRVTCAYNVFSMEVEAGLQTLVDNKTFPKQALTTAAFCKMIRTWYSFMSSRSLAKALTSSSSEIQNYLIKTMKIVAEMKNVTQSGSELCWKPIQSGLILSTQSVLELASELFKEGYSFILTERFTQDTLESYFSVIRAHTQSNPTVRKTSRAALVLSASNKLTHKRKPDWIPPEISMFAKRREVIVPAQLFAACQSSTLDTSRNEPPSAPSREYRFVQPPQALGLCPTDPSLSSLTSITLRLPGCNPNQPISASSLTLPQPDFVPYILPKLKPSELQACYHVCGYLLHKLLFCNGRLRKKICRSCHRSVSTKEIPQFAAKYTSRLNRGNLMFPSQDVFTFFLRVYHSVKKHYPNLSHEKSLPVLLYKRLEYLAAGAKLNICCDLAQKLLHIFVDFLLYLNLGASTAKLKHSLSSNWHHGKQPYKAPWLSAPT